jgi:hypothetical protein
VTTFRGSGGVEGGIIYPTEADLEAAIAAAEAAAAAAAVSQAAAAVNVADSQTAEDGAVTAQGLAESAEAAALVSEGLADADATATAADASATAADAVATDADAAATAADAADTAADVVTVAGIYDDFDDRYLGAKASDPTLDNDGDALLTGALYWNTTIPGLRIYTGSVWISVLDEASADVLYQPLDDELTDIALLAPTKGRLIVGNGSAWVDFGVGANEQVIEADSNETTGVKWGAKMAGGGGSLMESVGTSTWSGGNLTLAWSNAPEYHMIEFILTGIRAPLDDYVTLRFSADGGATWKTTNKYDYNFTINTGGGAGTDNNTILTGVRMHNTLSTARAYLKIQVYNPQSTAEAMIVTGTGSTNALTRPNIATFAGEVTDDAAYNAISIGGDSHVALTGGKIIAFGYK